MASAIDSALGRGLSVLAGTSGNGESFRVHGSGTTFLASLTSQVVPDGIGGRILETALVAPRSAFSALPADGLVIERADASEFFRVVECRPAAGGYIDVIVRSAQN